MTTAAILQALRGLRGRLDAIECSIAQAGHVSLRHLTDLENGLRVCGVSLGLTRRELIVSAQRIRDHSSLEKTP